MKKSNNYIILFFTIFLFVACGDIKEKVGKMQEQANQEFGDQNFKTAISLIELHKVRFGQYPKTLDSLEFLGEWDRNDLMNVKYQRVDSGYNLDLVKGFFGKPQVLNYPDSFWHGLGLLKSNMKK